MSTRAAYCFLCGPGKPCVGHVPTSDYGPPPVQPAEPGLLDEVNTRLADLEGTLRVALENIGTLRIRATSAEDRIAALEERLAFQELAVKKLRADLRSRGPESKRVGGRKR